jgi:RHS repeat-associated protein
MREYQGGPATDDLAATKYRNQRLWHLKDALGSTIALSNRVGQTIARMDYDAWGNFRFPDNPGHGVSPFGKYGSNCNPLLDFLDRLDGSRGFGLPPIDPRHLARHHGPTLTPYLYTGRRFDSFPGLYFNRHRYYSPRSGRFISKTPSVLVEVRISGTTQATTP